jgi:anthranilate synthase component 1
MIRVTPVAIEVSLNGPDSAYAAVRGTDTYLLESAEGGEKVARYSFIGFNPIAKLAIKNGKVRVTTTEPALTGLKPKGDDPLEVLRNLMAGFKMAGDHGARFFGGFVGYFSYDLVRYYIKLEDKKDELDEPDCEFVLCRNNIIFDHKAGKTLLSENVFGRCDEAAAKKRLAAIAASLRTPKLGAGKAHRATISSNMAKKHFCRMVRAARRYILAGDIIQAVLSQRFEADYSGDTFEVFRNLKRINPSPYMYHLDLGERKIVGSSPEMLARVEGRKVVTYPIAGTRARGETPEEDKKLEAELLADKKERAEHLMLVDLGRNDIGRVAKFGSVKVKKFMFVEKYSHVQHLVSEVEGELVEGKDCFDAFKSIFPAGTVSGAPKVRAMEIIDELEPCRRGIYAGSVGYFSFNGNMDTAISIRTIVFEGRKAYVQAGAGIVADSMPEREYQETVSKARGMIKALEGK